MLILDNYDITDINSFNMAFLFTCIDLKIPECRGSNKKPNCSNGGLLLLISETFSVKIILKSLLLKLSLSNVEGNYASNIYLN